MCDLSNRILLTLDAPQLSEEDREEHKGLVLLDGTWRYAQAMEEQLPQKEEMIKRSLPAHFVTTYPRRQTFCTDPSRGLATVEALYVAHKILGLPIEGILDHYFWADDFLRNNSI